MKQRTGAVDVMARGRIAFVAAWFAVFAGAWAAASGATAPAGAQLSASIVSVALTPSIATVGDRLILTIVIEHDAGTTAEGPGFAGDYGGLEVIDVAAPVVSESGSRRRTTLTHTLTAFRTGDVVIGSVPIRLRGPAGVQTIETNQVAVSIRSVLAPGETSLRPLKPQLELGDEAPSPIVPVMIVAGFAALTAAGYLLFRRGAQLRPVPFPGAIVPVAPPATAAEKARAQLDAIAGSGLVADDPPEYYARIAAVVRWYLSERFGFPAFAMTRRELDRHMRAGDADRWAGRVTGNLLEQCDAAQFAGFIPAMERRDADLTAAYEIVEITGDTLEAAGGPRDEASS